MSKKILTNLDLAQNELQNAVFNPLGSAPSSPKVAQVYYDTTLLAFRIYFGGQWNNLLDSTWIDTDGNLTANSDAKLATQKAIKTYVDNAVQGLSWKMQVRAGSTANVTVSSPGAAIDGVTLANGDRVALLAQTTASENGIYIFNGSSSALTRAKDADTGAELVNATFLVSEGTTNADTVWTCITNAPITAGTTALSFTQVNGGTVPAATTSVAGKVQLATQAEAEAKSVSTKAVTPSDLANFPIKKVATIGDGSATSIVVTDNLNTNDKIANIREGSTNAEVLADVTYGLNTTTFGFAAAPASNAYKVVLMG